MTRRRLLPMLLTLLTLAVAASRAHAVAGIGVVAASQGAAALAALIDSWNTELAQEVNDEKNRTKLFERLREAADKLEPIKEASNQATKPLNDQITKMEQEHAGIDSSEWSEKDRTEYRRLTEARAELEKVNKSLDEGWENLKWLRARQNVPGFDPFVNPNFKENFKKLGTQVGEAGATFKEFNDKYSVEGTGGGSGGGGVSVAAAGFVTASNPSTEMAFEVNGTMLLPQSKEVSVRLTEGRGLRVRALAYDEVRKNMVATDERLGPTGKGSVKVRERKIPYFLHYGTDELATYMRSESEKYEWQPGSQVTAAVGRSSPWAQDPTTIPEPTYSNSRDESTNDVLTWKVPAVDQGKVELTFTVTSTVRWMLGRGLAGGKTTENEESKTTSGTLSLVAAGG